MAKLIKQATLSEESCLLEEQPAPTVTVLDTVDRNQVQEKIQYQEGYTQGYEEGKAQSEEAFMAAKSSIEKLLQALPEALAENRLQLKNEIADIVLFICGQLFVEQQANKAALEQQINGILEQLSQQEHIELQLHPQDIACLQAGSIALRKNLVEKMTIKSNPGLRLGGCIIKTTQGIFDAGIEKQIDQLKQVLLEMRQEVPDESQP